MLVPMAKVRVVGMRAHLEPTVARLHELGVMELMDVRECGSEDVHPWDPEPEHRRRADGLRALRTRLDALRELLDVGDVGHGEEAETPDEEGLERVREELDERMPLIEEHTRRIDELRAERDALPRHLHAVRRLAPLVPELPQLERWEVTGLLLDARHEDLIRALREEIEEITGGRSKLLWARTDPDTVAAVLVHPRACGAEVRARLGRAPISRIRLPARYERMSLRTAEEAMARRIEELPGEIEETRQALRDLVAERLARWKAARRAIEEQLDRLAALDRAGATERTFVLIGWVPRPRFEELERSLDDAVGAEVLVEECRIEEEDAGRVPVLLRNPGPARPFEMLVRLFSLPRYGTPDPTLMMTVFIPLFFGLMLGDVAYGALVFGGALLVRRRFGRRSRGVRDLASILAMGGLAAVGFGIAFGELLGDLGHRLGMEPLWMDRQEAAGPLLLLAVAVGAGHVVLGLLLGVWIALRERRRSEITERAGTLVVLVGLFLLAGTAAEHLPAAVRTPSVVAVVVGAVVVIGFRGPMGFVEGPLHLLRAVSNVLSYLRLAALGLASVYLARVANEVGAAAPLWIGVLLAALLHSLNLLLGAFSPTIQALRLQYVEFFEQFYPGGGRPFRPLGGGVDE
ncbi:MAG: V-type ATP synthase subunit I [Myxococcota bacterium]